ncbi:hypothetical protein FB45DRAFT_1009405, partial [Roridomyces roridus]
MPRIVHIRSIHVKSMINEHPDLPAGMKMFAQLVVNNVIIQQTVSVEQEQIGTWKMEFDYNIPANVTTFYITILREAQGVRLIGFAEIAQGPDEGLAFGEEQKPFRLPLTRVNIDAPVLTLAVELNSIAVGLSSRNDMAIQIGPLDGETVHELWAQKLMGLLTSTDFQDLWIMHELILFLFPANQGRRRMLNLLGHICLKWWNTNQSMEALNQAVLAYDDAVREDGTDANSLDGLRMALSERVKALHNGVDMDRHAQVTEKMLFLIEDGHPGNASTSLNLRRSLITQFEELGSMDDLQRSVSMHEDAVRLTPEGHPDRASMLNNLGNSLMTQFEQ